MQLLEQAYIPQVMLGIDLQRLPDFEAQDSAEFRTSYCFEHLVQRRAVELQNEDTR